MPRPPVHLIADPSVWEVLLAPARAEILETLRMIGPCAIADVASQLDRPADSLYKHFEKLVATGVVVEAGSRPSGRRYERLYDVVADDFSARFGSATRKAVNDAYLATAKTITEMSLRTFRGAAAAGELVGLGLDKPCNTRAFFEHVWLTPADFAELNAIFRRLNDFLNSKKTRSGTTRLHLVSVLAAPIVRRRGAARTRANVSPRRARPAASTPKSPSRSRKRAP